MRLTDMRRDQCFRWILHASCVRTAVDAGGKQVGQVGVVTFLALATITPCPV
jgi:hypothetical protein